LEEVNSVYEPVEARALGVESQLAHAGDVIEEEPDLLWRVYVLKGV
jgi:hypothetical protein